MISLPNPNHISNADQVVAECFVSQLFPDAAAVSSNTPSQSDQNELSSRRSNRRRTCHAASLLGTEGAAHDFKDSKLRVCPQCTQDFQGSDLQLPRARVRILTADVGSWGRVRDFYVPWQWSFGEQSVPARKYTLVSGETMVVFQSQEDAAQLDMRLPGCGRVPDSDICFRLCTAFKTFCPVQNFAMQMDKSCSLHGLGKQRRKSREKEQKLQQQYFENFAQEVFNLNAAVPTLDADQLMASSVLSDPIVAQCTQDLRVLKDLHVHGDAWKAGGSNHWRLFSDSRVKHVLGEFNLGVGVLVKLVPRLFTYTGAAGTPSDGAVYVGLIAQEIPEEVAEFCRFQTWVKLQPEDEEKTQLWLVDYSFLQFILINAVKHQDAQLELLEQMQQVSYDSSKRHAEGIEKMMFSWKTEQSHLIDKQDAQQSGMEAQQMQVEGLKAELTQQRQLWARLNQSNSPEQETTMEEGGLTSSDTTSTSHSLAISDTKDRNRFTLKFTDERVEDQYNRHKFLGLRRRVRWTSAVVVFFCALSAMVMAVIPGALSTEFEDLQELRPGFLYYYMLGQSAPSAFCLYLTYKPPSKGTINALQWSVSSLGWFNMSVYLCFLQQFCKHCSYVKLGRHPPDVLLALVLLAFALPSFLHVPWTKSTVTYIAMYCSYCLFILPDVVGDNKVTDIYFILSFFVAIAAARSVEYMSRHHFATLALLNHKNQGSGTSMTTVPSSSGSSNSDTSMTTVPSTAPGFWTPLNAGQLELLGNSQQLMVLMSHQGVLKETLGELAAPLDREGGQLVGVNWFSLVHTTDHDRVKLAIQRGIGLQIPQVLELRMRAVDGSYQRVRCTLSCTAASDEASQAREGHVAMLIQFDPRNPCCVEPNFTSKQL